MRHAPATIAITAAAAALLLGCSSDDASSTPTPTPKELILALLDHPCDDPLDSVYEPQAAPSSWAPPNRGDVVACAYERVVTVEEMRQAYLDVGFEVPELTTAAHKLRVAYWTERAAGEPILTSGALYFPETRVADPAPLLVVGHGSVGVADMCAPSREHPDGTHKDWRAQLYALAGDGWVTFQPDFPGLGTPGRTSWMHSLDEGHAILDATRAARKLAAAGTFSDKNALVGHSNGGHAVLSALAYAASYGTAGPVAAVVVYSPFWISNGAWGALISPLGGSLMTSTFMAMTMQYFTGHLEIYEGPDHALDAFLPDKAQQADEMLDGGCWHYITKAENGPPAIGVNVAADLYTAEYRTEVGVCGNSDSCTSELAQTWRERWVIDRPPIESDIPIVHWMGAKDDFSTPSFQMCGIERVEGTGGQVELCIDPEGAHSDIVSSDAGWVKQYLAHELLGADAPAACPGPEAMDPPPTCQLPIPNSTDPTDP